ncbi:hypothetical protein V1279_006125 [Bradyrhizobium sp. AZCC 1610]|uniref:DUF6602 domain-containing protein n=1 Tax=Bradyrhizobium sp. AZCC 1610 TaxID=3117020 RepID=UPI002FF37ED8
MGRPLPRSPFLNSRFGAAVEEFGIALKKSSSIVHRGNKGTSREESLRQFFRERIPKAFAVVEGEVVDLVGSVSPQLDLMFYNQSINFALNADQSSILPAEALLASVEVKTTLSKNEIEKSVIAAKKLRQLRPFDRTLGGVDVGDAPQKVNIARYYHCLFAYGSDLSEKDWMKREAERIRSICGSEHLIDSVYVLNRGLLNISANVGRLEDDHGGAISNFYFSILNFIQRENGRRAETPFYRYMAHASRAWSKLN